MTQTLLAFEQTVMLTFLAAALVLFLTPGPNMMFTIASGAAGGTRAGFSAAVGIALGTMVHVAVAAAGLGALILAEPAAYQAIRWAGVVYLAFVAVQLWRAAPASGTQRGSGAMRRAFTRGFVTNILNPKVILFIMAFLPQFTDPAIGPVWQQIVILGVLLALIGLAVDGLCGFFAGWMGERISRATGIMNKLAAIVFGSLAARLAVS